MQPHRATTLSLVWPWIFCVLTNCDHCCSGWATCSISPISTHCGNMDKQPGDQPGSPPHSLPRPDPSNSLAQAPNASRPLEIPPRWVLFFSHSPFTLGCVTALVLYYWNVWLWLVQQMKRLNANVWFPRGPPRLHGLQVFAVEGGGRLKCINANYAWHCLYFLLLIGAGEHPRFASEVFFEVNAQLVANPSSSCPWGVRVVKISQALNMRNVGSTRTSPWLRCSE